MNDFDNKWQRLVALARQAPDPRDDAAPLGFATRVAARALAEPASPWLIFEKLTLRGLAVAAALMVAALALNFAASGPDLDEQQSFLDPVAEVLDLS
jgi:hypothetical protein